MPNDWPGDTPLPSPFRKSTQKTLDPLTPGRFPHSDLSSLLCHMVGLALVLPGGFSLTTRARQGLSQLRLSQALA